MTCGFLKSILVFIGNDPDFRGNAVWLNPERLPLRTEKYLDWDPSSASSLLQPLTPGDFTFLGPPLTLPSLRRAAEGLLSLQWLSPARLAPDGTW